MQYTGAYKVRPQIKETTKEATNILTTTIRENDVMDLIDKGIIEVYIQTGKNGFCFLMVSHNSIASP